MSTRANNRRTAALAIWGAIPVLVVGFSIGFVRSVKAEIAFREPDQPAPLGTFATPLNTSETEQKKTGKLVIEGGLEAFVPATGIFVPQPPALSVGTSDRVGFLCINPQSGADSRNNPNCTTRLFIPMYDPPSAPADDASGQNSYFNPIEASKKWGGQLTLSSGLWAIAGEAGSVATDDTFTRGVFGVSANDVTMGIERFTTGIYGLGRKVRENLDEDARKSRASVIFAGYFKGPVGFEGNKLSDVSTRFAWQSFRSSARGGDWEDTERWIFTGKEWADPYYLEILSRYKEGGNFNYRSVMRLTETGNVGIIGRSWTGRYDDPGSSPKPRLLVNKVINANEWDPGNANDAVGIYANTTSSALYAQQNDDDGWAGFFSGWVNITNGNLCFNGTDCISNFGGVGLWERDNGVIHPSNDGDKFAIGGSNPSAPLFFDPTAASLSLNAGTLQLNDGALTLKGASQGPPSPPGGRCFLAGTPVTMADGTTKAIEKIQVGERVLAWDEVSKTLKPARVTELYHHTPADLYLVVNGHLKVTPEHRVLSAGQWVEIGKLAVGDTLTDASGQAILIRSIKTVRERVPVFNLEVETYHTYIADGFIVHNRKNLDKGFMNPPSDSRATLASLFSPRIPAALAGIVTNPGAAPENRLIVKNGVIAIDTDQSDMELGYEGRDIASSGTLYLRPGSLPSGVGVAISKPQAGPLNANLYVPGNTALGVPSSLGRLTVNQNLTVENQGDVDNAISAIANTTGAAVYGQQDNGAGWAGYFSGGVFSITPDEISSNSLVETKAVFALAGAAQAINGNAQSIGVEARGGQAYGLLAIPSVGASYGVVAVGGDVPDGAYQGDSYGIMAAAGELGTGVQGKTYGIWAETGAGGSENWAGYFSGDVRVTGKLKVDGPLIGGCFEKKIIGVTEPVWRGVTPAELEERCSRGCTVDLEYELAAGSADRRLATGRLTYATPAGFSDPVYSMTGIRNKATADPVVFYEGGTLTPEGSSNVLTVTDSTWSHFCNLFLFRQAAFPNATMLMSVINAHNCTLRICN